jgi:hypothetical protein
MRQDDQSGDKSPHSKELTHFKAEQRFSSAGVGISSHH